MDFRADRISDFMVYYLSDTTGKYEEYVNIPLSAAYSNITDCMPWIVCLSLTICYYHLRAIYAEGSSDGSMIVLRVRAFVLRKEVEKRTFNIVLMDAASGCLREEGFSVQMW